MGKKWVRQFWLFGPWILVDDPEFPLPPDGFRYATNFWTGRRELVSVRGEGVNFFADGNERKVPRGPNMDAINNYGTPSNPIYYRGDVIESGAGIQFVGPGTDSDPRLRRPGQSRYKPYSPDEAAIF